jgi:hypothetical protein
VKAIRFTRHAKNRIRWHKISEAEVISAIDKPQHLESSIQGRINAWTETFGKFLRVTYKEEGDRILVITAVKKKKRWG